MTGGSESDGRREGVTSFARASLQLGLAPLSCPSIDWIAVWATH